jgi:DNA-binding LacI/PurR family transcriptional regulator
MPKRATARAVAERAGVSRTTVSFVLNNVSGMRIPEETRQRVLQAATDLDYHPDATARRMVSGRTHVIGFVIRQTPDQVFADALLPQMLGGLSKAARAHNLHILFEPIPPDELTGAYGGLLRERHVDGIILFGPRMDDQELRRIHDDGSCVVLIGQLPDTQIPYVDVDNIGGARLATGHLIRLGHRRIAHITNAPSQYTASTDRLSGYQEALKAAGIEYDPNLVRYGEFTPQSGQASMAELLDVSPRPTAVFIGSDAVALGALQQLHQRGVRVPEDMAVVGFDDIPLAGSISPSLTTVRIPSAGLGWGAADLLARIIDRDEEVRNPFIILETELVVRASCGASAQYTEARTSQTPPE